jgi:hypothetical protein
MVEEDHFMVELTKVISWNPRITVEIATSCRTSKNCEDVQLSAGSPPGVSNWHRTDIKSALTKVFSLTLHRRYNPRRTSGARY